MVERKVIVDKVSTFVGEKLNEVLDSNPFSFIHNEPSLILGKFR